MWVSFDDFVGGNDHRDGDENSKIGDPGVAGVFCFWAAHCSLREDGVYEALGAGQQAGNAGDGPGGDVAGSDRHSGGDT